MKATNVVGDNIVCLQQGIDLLRGLDPALYAGRDRRHGVGPQFRHVIEHYEVFLAGAPEGRVDYDDRRRDARLDDDRGEALHRLTGICAALAALAPERLGDALRIKMDCGEGCEEDPWAASTTKRELQFLLSHTVHHYALIAQLLKARGVEPAAGFGVAPSTLRYWRQQQPAASADRQR